MMTYTHHRYFLCEEAWRYLRVEKGLNECFLYVSVTVTEDGCHISAIRSYMLSKHASISANASV